MKMAGPRSERYRVASTGQSSTETVKWFNGQLWGRKDLPTVMIKIVFGRLGVQSAVIEIEVQDGLQYSTLMLRSSRFDQKAAEVG
jgi:hypothetical protein